MLEITLAKCDILGVSQNEGEVPLKGIKGLYSYIGLYRVQSRRYPWPSAFFSLCSYWDAVAIA